MGGASSKLRKRVGAENMSFATGPRSQPSTSTSAPARELPDSVRHCEQYHGRSLLDGLKKQRADDRFCDVILRIGETVIKAHKVVLASSSSYFEALLGSDMQEGHQDEIHLERLDGPIVSTLVDFIYSGQVTITTLNVQKLLEAANFLDIKGVQKACCRFMEERIDVDCCTGLLNVADYLAEEKLKESAMTFIENNFQDVAESADLTSLHPPLLEMILSSERLSLTERQSTMPLAPALQEAKLANFVLQYVRADLVVRSEVIENLLKKIRLPLLQRVDLDLFENDLKELQGELECCGLVDSIQFIKNSLELVRKARVTQVREPLDSKASPWCRPRRFSGLTYVTSQKFVTDMRAGQPISTFDDKEIAEGSYLVGMKVWIRRWDGRPVVGGFLVSYSNGKSIQHGGDTFPEVYEFVLQGGEYITEVSLRCGWMLDCLTFISNKGRTFGPYGGDGGSPHQVRNSSHGLLTYISGAVVHAQNALAITRISFTWGVYAFKDASGSKGLPSQSGRKGKKTK